MWFASKLFNVHHTVDGFDRKDYVMMNNLLLVVVVALPLIVRGQNTDLFNYDTTRDWEEGKDYGPRKWDQVECDDLDKCVSTVTLVVSCFNVLTEMFQCSNRCALCVLSLVQSSSSVWMARKV